MDNFQSKRVLALLQYTKRILLYILTTATKLSNNGEATKEKCDSYLTKEGD